MRHFLSQHARLFSRDQRGVSAIEFAVVAPLVLVLLAAVVDFGLLLQTRSSIETATSSAMSYALARGQDLNASNAVSYTTSVADIAGRQMGEDVAVNVTLNSNLVVSRRATGTQQSGSGGAANLCYCPERDDGAVVWGTSTTCDAPCPGGGFAGRFLSIKASKHYQPLFIGFGMVSEGQVVVETLAGLQ